MLEELCTELQKLHEEFLIEGLVFYRMSQRCNKEGDAAALYGIAMKLNEMQTLVMKVLPKLQEARGNSTLANL